jgi:hypothetical protein
MEDGLLKTHAADVALPASSGLFGGGCQELLLSLGCSSLGSMLLVSASSSPSSPSSHAPRLCIYIFIISFISFIVGSSILIKDASDGKREYKGFDVRYLVLLLVSTILGFLGMCTSLCCVQSRYRRPRP